MVFRSTEPSLKKHGRQMEKKARQRKIYSCTELSLVSLLACVPQSWETDRKLWMWQIGLLGYTPAAAATKGAWRHYKINRNNEVRLRNVTQQMCSYCSAFRANNLRGLCCVQYINNACCTGRSTPRGCTGKGWAGWLSETFWENSGSLDSQDDVTDLLPAWGRKWGILFRRMLGRWHQSWRCKKSDQRMLAHFCVHWNQPFWTITIIPSMT